MKKIFLILAVLLLLAGCARQKDFEYGMGKLSSINSKYGTTLETYPKNVQQIDNLSSELNALKNDKLDSGEGAFTFVINYRLLNLDAEKLFIQSQKHGFYDLGKTGFGCKPRPLILESVRLRNESAKKGFEAVDLLREFIQKYPKEANTAGLSEKNALFLNASFYEIQRISRRDSNLINNFCPKNVTLDLYREEILKKTNLSEGYVSNLSYEKAAEIWLVIRSIEK